MGGGVNNLLQDPLLKSIAEKYGKTPAQIILRWNIDRDVISIPKSVHASRLKENWNIFDFKLSNSDIVAINKLNKNERVGSDPDKITF